MIERHQGISEGQILLLVLVLAYIAECFIWLDRFSLCFVRWWGEYRSFTASLLWGSRHQSLLAINPFPPFSSVLTSSVLPISISPETLTAFNSQTMSTLGRPIQSNNSVSISAITNVSVTENTLHINGTPFCRFYDNNSLAEAAILIGNLARTEESKRETILHSFWKHRMSVGEFTEALNSYAVKTKRLRRLCTVQFLLFFVGFPAISLFIGVGDLLIPGSIAVFLLAFAIGVEFNRTYKQIDPANKTFRISTIIRYVLFPPASIRAVDQLSQKSLASFHPIVSAAVLLSLPSRVDVVGSMIRDLANPICDSTVSPESLAASKWQNALIIKLVKTELTDLAENINNIVPVIESKNIASYCPRCLVQFSRAVSKCPDCAGVELVNFGAVSCESKTLIKSQ